MEDSQIIDLFFERSERAIDELSKKYGASCMKVAFNVLGNKEDSEECVNDSFFGVWNKIPPEKPNPLLVYLLRIVKNLSIKRCQYNGAKKRADAFILNIEDFEWVSREEDSTEKKFDTMMISQYIDEFLDMVSEENRMLFVRRYWYFDKISDIAKEAGLKEATVRKRLQRIRDELKFYLLGKGVSI